MTFKENFDQAKYSSILEAAVAEFESRGFPDASMDRISARAEVSKRTLYKYFESKDRLLISIIELAARRLAELEDLRYSPERPIREQLVELAWAEGQILRSPDAVAISRIIISETLRNPELAEATRGRLDKTRAFAAMLRAAAEDGALIIADPQEAAQEFIALIKAKAFWPVIFGEEIVSEARMGEIIETSVDFIMLRYGVPRAGD
jgi:TetR/AcrR family transcriptional regulator of autoinduction and epiphytic fitness